MSDSSEILAQLMRVIERGAESNLGPSGRIPRRSYSTAGSRKSTPKITEEAAEVVEAAGGESGQAGREHLVREAADLVYHLFVMLALRDA